MLATKSDQGTAIGSVFDIIVPQNSEKSIGNENFSLSANNEYSDSLSNTEDIAPIGSYNVRGKLLKDITKIKNIIEDMVSRYGKNPPYIFLHDVSVVSIPQNF